MMKTGILLCIFKILQCLTKICADETRTLLKVGAGTGVSFIDLWDMTGTSVGNEMDSVYRNGILDNELKNNCPKRLYFLLIDGSSVFSITYRGPFKSFALTSWITYQPFFITYNLQLEDYQIDVTIPPVVYCYALLFLSNNALGNIESRDITLDKLATAALDDDQFVTELERPLAIALLERCASFR